MRTLRWAALVCLGLSLGASTAAAQTYQIAKGVVYHDQNANGKRDRNETGVAGVHVSNGREVVTTGKDGSYALPISDDATIFVVKPRGYRFPVNDRYLPQFYYTHKPAGSATSLQYKGIAPTGQLPASIDFGLIQAEDPTSYKVLLFSDTQVYGLDQVDFLDRDVIAEWLGHESEFVFGLTMGDVVGDNLDLYDPLTNVTRKLGIPWFHVLGNHDMNYDVTRNEDHDDTFTRVFGPATYAMQQGQAHFIVFDDVIYPRPDGRNGYIGGLTDQALDFIENYLKLVPKEDLIVMNMHIPLYFENGNETFRAVDRDRLFRILKDHPNTVSISGHTHYQLHYFFDEAEGWLQEKPHHHYNMGTASGDWYSGTLDDRGIPDATMRDGTPNGSAIMQIDGNKYTFDFTPAGAHDRKFTLTVPKVVGPQSGQIVDFYANFYQGSEKCTLEYRIDNGDWRSMARIDREDPTMVSYREEWFNTEELLSGRRPSNLVLSTHLWRAKFPSELSQGEHTVEVRATDMFGRQFTEKARFRVVQ